MGGFCLLRAPVPALPARQAAADRAAAALGLPEPGWLPLPGGAVGYWRKSLAGAPQLWRGPGEDFALAAGTFIFDELAGPAALAAFHAAAARAEPRALLPRTLGHFALLLRRGERCWLLHDRGGFFQVFRAAGDRLLSTSFLLAAALLDRVSVDPQGLAEYVLTGVPLGDATPLAELRLLGRGADLELDAARLREHAAAPDLPDQPAWPDAATAREACLAALRGVVGRTLTAMGPEVACALSGGYDSRLVLALLRDQGVRPALFVYGQPGSADVVTAERIAAAEGLPLDHVDKGSLAPLEPERFAAEVAANFLAQDGYGQEGIFDNGGERLARQRRVAAAPLQLHGGGGETLRNFFYLPDRPYRPRQVLLAFWGQFDPAALLPPLRAEDYLANLEAKLGSLLGTGPAPLPRPHVDWLYPAFRCRAWVGREGGNNQRFAPLLTPFLEPPAVAAALRVPLALRAHGRFEGGLIRALDPALAAHASAYGHPLDGAVPPRRRLLEELTYRRPPWLRHASFRLKQRLTPAPPPSPALAPALLHAILPEGPTLLRHYFRPDRLQHPDQAQRLLSAEYLLRHLGSKLRPA